MMERIKSEKFKQGINRNLGFFKIWFAKCLLLRLLFFYVYYNCLLEVFCEMKFLAQFMGHSCH